MKSYKALEESLADALERGGQWQDYFVEALNLARREISKLQEINEMAMGRMKGQFDLTEEELLDALDREEDLVEQHKLLVSKYENGASERQTQIAEIQFEKERAQAEIGNLQEEHLVIEKLGLVRDIKKYFEKQPNHQSIQNEATFNQCLQSNEAMTAASTSNLTRNAPRDTESHCVAPHDVAVHGRSSIHTDGEVAIRNIDENKHTAGSPVACSIQLDDPPVTIHVKDQTEGPLKSRLNFATPKHGSVEIVLLGAEKENTLASERNPAGSTKKAIAARSRLRSIESSSGSTVKAVAAGESIVALNSSTSINSFASMMLQP